MSNLTREFNYLLNHTLKKRPKIPPIMDLILRQIINNSNDLEKIKHRILKMPEHIFTTFFAQYDKLMNEMYKVLNLKEKENYNNINPTEGKVHEIVVICPICKTSKEINVPEGINYDGSGISSISIPRNIVCQHHFQVFIDKFFIVRGYQEIDYEIEGENQFINHSLFL